MRRAPWGCELPGDGVGRPQVAAEWHRRLSPWPEGGTPVGPVYKPAGPRWLERNVRKLPNMSLSRPVSGYPTGQSTPSGPPRASLPPLHLWDWASLHLYSGDTGCDPITASLRGRESPLPQGLQEAWLWPQPALGGKRGLTVQTDQCLLFFPHTVGPRKSIRVTCTRDRPWTRSGGWEQSR